MTDERLRRLHDHLDATAELPVEREASAYLGEAEAVARDLVERSAESAVVRERTGHVRDLLAEIEGTGNTDADEHVAEARALASELAGEGADD
ncbi:hypothetical protein [Halorarum salinum]|uniref:DUF8152 domain-containing protein n=1 Tax=Halorarum salinum TaxID=2743089 RepID=A0A7D5L8K7_9EURY|nr:hypothetical protein [Halobaculum salinum]QLG60568.1 hypothetical protein HUG12_01930 [Halobaculum salinum]